MEDEPKLSGEPLELLSLSVAEPTIGCRQYAERLGELGYAISETTMQKLLVDHQLGKRVPRVVHTSDLGRKRMSKALFVPDRIVQCRSISARSRSFRGVEAIAEPSA